MKKTNWNDIPFSPKRFPFFYGWIIVAAGIFGYVASIPGQTMGVSVFTDFIMKVLDLERTPLTVAYMAGTISSGLLLSYAGQMLDRFGARVMIVVSASGLGLAVFLFSISDKIAHINNINSFYFTFSAISFIFLMLRFFGQGCMTMVTQVLIGKWFNHRRGLAAAISGIFVSFGFNGSPQILNWMVETHGWRDTCFYLSLIIGCGMSIFGWIFYRDNPEDCGLVMDGITDKAWHKKMAEKVAETKKEFTRSEAIRTFSFWSFCMGLASQALIMTGATFHIASIGSEAGLTRDASFAVFLPMAAFSIVANFVSGWISDRIRVKWLLFTMMLAQVIGTTGLLIFGTSLGRFFFMIGFGVTGGLFGTLMNVVFPRFYGRKHLGAISGLNVSMIVLGSALGPVFLSLGRSLTERYFEFLLLSILMPVVILIASLKADNPQEKL